jgi:hypothetical protein
VLLLVMHAWPLAAGGVTSALKHEMLQVRRIAAAPHSQEEAEAAMAASPKSDSVRSISLTGLRDPSPAADLAHQRSLTLQASRRRNLAAALAGIVGAALADGMHACRHGGATHEASCAEFFVLQVALGAAWAASEAAES